MVDQRLSRHIRSLYNSYETGTVWVLFSVCDRLVFEAPKIVDRKAKSYIDSEYFFVVQKETF